jgi:hypothetical protein
MDWIRIPNVIPLDTRVFLWDIERETATVGKFINDPDHGTIVSAYNDYYDINCFSHYSIIEPPIN